MHCPISTYLRQCAAHGCGSVRFTCCCCRCFAEHLSRLFMIHVDAWQGGCMTCARNFEITDQSSMPSWAVGPGLSRLLPGESAGPTARPRRECRFIPCPY